MPKIILQNMQCQRRLLESATLTQDESETFNLINKYTVNVSKGFTTRNSLSNFYFATEKKKRRRYVISFGKKYIMT